MVPFARAADHGFEKEPHMRENQTKLPFLALFAVSIALVFNAPSARAIPAFARMHKTSCQTCHIGFPKLNAVGESFRLNGYRMPGENMAEEPPQSLGAEAYKKMWPKAIWPSDIPAHIPLALNIKMVSAYESSLDESGRTVTKNDFQFPQEANLFSAGTLGDHMGFLGEVTWSEGASGTAETELEHAELHINSPFGPEHLVNFKIGKFAPDLADGFQEMWISTDNGIDTLFSYNPIGVNGGNSLAEDGGGISLPAIVKGIETYGVSHHRFFYTAGVTNGLGPSASGNVDANAHKDMYARV